MMVFTRFSSIFLFISISCSSFAQWSQSASLAALPQGNAVVAATKTNFNVTPCGGTVKDLDTNVSPEILPHDAASGLMNNDTWFSFKTIATAAKIRVCDPTFDAVVEVWTLDGLDFITSFNIAPNGGREFKLVTGLVYDANYAVRVGRFSGSGAGSFSFNVECFPVSVLANYSPGPPGNTCYLRSQFVNRNAPSFSPAGSFIQTRWGFHPTNGDPSQYCVTSTGTAPLTCASPCIGDIFNVSCDAQANDLELGLGPLYWGTSIIRQVKICDQICLGITAPANNSSLANIRTTSFQTANLGTGATAQWRFVTDNGATVICSPWIANHQLVPSPPLSTCLENNKYYSVSVRIKYCSDDPEPEWCAPISVFSQPLARITLPSTDCCIWRNKLGAITANYVGFTMSSFRFRFTPVANTANQCPSNNLAPIGSALVTTWNAYYGTTTNYANIQQGTIYNVQVQGKLNSISCANCAGSNQMIPERYTDWGPPCLMGFRLNNGPAAGTPLSCGCNIGAMMALEDWDEEAYAALIAQFGTIEISEGEEWIEDEQNNQVLSVYSIAPGTLQMNLSRLELHGENEIRIHDLNGRLITSRPVFNTEDKNALLISVNKNLPSGIYVISVIGDNAVITEKIFISGY